MYELSLFGCFLFHISNVVLMDFMKRKHKNNTRVFNCEIQFHDLFRRNSHLFSFHCPLTHLHSLFSLTKPRIRLLQFQRAPVAYFFDHLNTI